MDVGNLPSPSKVEEVGKLSQPSDEEVLPLASVIIRETLNKNLPKVNPKVLWPLVK